MQSRNQTIIPLTRLDIQRMVFEAVRRLRVPLDEGVKWDYDACYNEAKKYNSKVEFQRKNKSVYEKARRMGWLNDYTWFSKPQKELKWTQKSCYDEAKKYKSRGEFQRSNNSAYQVARENGWLDDYTWFSPSASISKWNHDTCYEEAKKYKSRTEFYRNSPQACKVARENGWLDEYTWFSELPKRNYWNKETCYEEAKKYKSRSEFVKNSAGAYAVAKKNGWLDDYTWFETKKTPNGYWNYDRCYEEAKKYKSRTEFQRNSHAYQVARVNGWLDDYTWFEKRAISEKNIYVAYCYEDKDTNAVYVGLTNNLKRRHNEHATGTNLHGNPIRDTVYEYFKSIGKEVPEPIILQKNIYAKDAQDYEAHYVEQFKNEGKKVLNLAKTGSLGGLGKWTKEKCYNVAKTCKSRKELEIKAKGAYVSAIKNGWIDDYTWFKPVTSHPKGYWTYDKCYEEAKKYKSRHEFEKNSPQAYRAAHKNGWINNYTWFKTVTSKTKGHYTKEKCYEEARKYKSASEFKRNCPSAYVAARKNGWLKDYDWFVKLHKDWNYGTCYEEAKKYKSRNEFGRKSGRAYEVARKNGWLDDYTWFQRPSRSNQAALG